MLIAAEEDILAFCSALESAAEEGGREAQRVAEEAEEAARAQRVAEEAEEAARLKAEEEEETARLKAKEEEAELRRLEEEARLATLLEQQGRETWGNQWMKI